MENSKSIEKTGDIADLSVKLEWSAPRLEVLDFGSTQGGGTPGPEGEINGFPVGTS